MERKFKYEMFDNSKYYYYYYIYIFKSFQRCIIQMCLSNEMKLITISKHSSDICRLQLFGIIVRL